jgi:hypothetical protein
MLFFLLRMLHMTGYSFVHPLIKRMITCNIDDAHAMLVELEGAVDSRTDLNETTEQAVLRVLEARSSASGNLPLYAHFRQELYKYREGMMKNPTLTGQGPCMDQGPSASLPVMPGYRILPPTFHIHPAVPITCALILAAGVAVGLRRRRRRRRRRSHQRTQELGTH